MSATGPFATILSERAALLAVDSGAVESVADPEEELDDDKSGLEEEAVVAGREAVVTVEEPEVEETAGTGADEPLKTVEDAAVTKAGVPVEVADTDVVEISIGPGPPRLNRIE